VYIGGAGGCVDSLLCFEFSVSTAPQPTTGTVSVDSASICAGESVTFALAGGQLGGASQWVWYADSCGGTSVGTGDTITITPDSSGTWFVRAEGCDASSFCVSGSVAVEQAPTGPAIQLLFGDTLFASTEADSYQWYLDGAAIPNATNQWLVPTASGLYTVEALGPNGCPSPGSSVFSYTLPPGTGIEELPIPALRVWPNPASQQVQLQLEGGLVQAPFRLLNSMGQLLASGTMRAGEAQLDVSGLAPGMYILEAPQAHFRPVRLLIR